jgi:hypothetical protein
MKDIFLFMKRCEQNIAEKLEEMKTLEMLKD